MKDRLHNLFGKVPDTDDLAYDVYSTIQREYSQKGLLTVVMVSKIFAQIKPEFVQCPLPLFFSLVSGSRVQPQMLLEKKTLRELIHNYFLIFDEDQVVARLGSGEDVVWEESGLVKDLKVDTNKIKERNFPPGTLLTLEIKLLNASPVRALEENRSFFGLYDQALEAMKKDELHQQVISAITDESLRAKRLALYQANSVEEVKGQDFGSKDVLKIKKVLLQMSNPYLSNEQLVALEPSSERSDLKKMRDWLKRSLG